jgi:short-subunit dehydrogenase
MDTVLILGASGLLGTETVKLLSERGLSVYAQYHKKKPSDIKNVKWIYGDFSDFKGVKKFIGDNEKTLINSKHFINSYGPITYKDIKILKTFDYKNDFFSNLLVPVEIIGFILNKNPNIKNIINIGFELTGKFQPVKKILPYMIAKNSLYQYSISMGKIYKDINFIMINPPTMTGAEFASTKGKTVNPKKIAEKILKNII